MWRNENTITAKIVFYGTASTVQKSMASIYQAFSVNAVPTKRDPLSTPYFESDAGEIDHKTFHLFFMGTPDHATYRLLMLKETDTVVFCWSEDETEDQNKQTLSELCLNLEKLGTKSEYTKLVLLFDHLTREPSVLAETVSGLLSQFQRTLDLTDVFNITDPKKVYDGIVHSTQSLYTELLAGPFISN